MNKPTPPPSRTIIQGKLPKYRLVEICDVLINEGKAYWQIEKRHWLWGTWDSYFGVHQLSSATFFDKEEALRWWKTYKTPDEREVKTILDEAY